MKESTIRTTPALVYSNRSRIKHNRIRCKLCDFIIESYHVHDFKYCHCGSVAVDGGREYLRRLGDLENVEELSEYND